MSQTYCIRVATSVCVPVGEQRDRVTRRIALPHLRGVDPAEVAEVLAGVLRARAGWRDEGEGVHVRSRGQVQERLDTRSGELELTTSTSEATLDVEGQAVVGRSASREAVERACERQRAMLRARAERTLAHTDQAERAARRELAERIEGSEEERTAELLEVVRATTSEVLQRLATRLGKVTAVEEQTGDDYELVIRIEV